MIHEPTKEQWAEAERVSRELRFSSAIHNDIQFIAAALAAAEARGRAEMREACKAMLAALKLAVLGDGSIEHPFDCNPHFTLDELKQIRSAVCLGDAVVRARKAEEEGK